MGKYVGTSTAGLVCDESRAGDSYDGKTPNAQTYPVTITHRAGIIICVIVTLPEGLSLMAEPHFEILN